jgi:hypothetical protein
VASPHHQPQLVQACQRPHSGDRHVPQAGQQDQGEHEAAGQGHRLVVPPGRPGPAGPPVVLPGRRTRPAPPEVQARVQATAPGRLVPPGDGPPEPAADPGDGGHGGHGPRDQGPVDGQLPPHGEEGAAGLLPGVADVVLGPKPDGHAQGGDGEQGAEEAGEDTGRVAPEGADEPVRGAAAAVHGLEEEADEEALQDDHREGDAHPELLEPPPPGGVLLVPDDVGDAEPAPQLAREEPDDEQEQQGERQVPAELGEEVVPVEPHELQPAVPEEPPQPPPRTSRVGCRRCRIVGRGRHGGSPPEG